MFGGEPFTISGFALLASGVKPCLRSGEVVRGHRYREWYIVRADGRYESRDGTQRAMGRMAIISSPCSARKVFPSAASAIPATRTVMQVEAGGTLAQSSHNTKAISRESTLHYHKHLLYKCNNVATR